MGFEIEKSKKDGTFTSREVVNGKITRSNSGVNTPQSAYKTITGWVKRDVKHTGVKVESIKKAKGKAGIESHVYIGTCSAKKFIPVKEINC